MLFTKTKQFRSLETRGGVSAACCKFRRNGSFKVAVLLSSTVLFSSLHATTIALDSTAPDSTAPIQGRSDIIEKSRVSEKDWDSYERTIQLADGTSLHHYVAEVSTLETAAAGAGDSEDTLQPKLRFSFIPRFNCAPIISVIFAADTIDEASRQKILLALNQMKFLVDGTSIAFPALTEVTDASLMAHYDTELRRRNNFRILVEAGSTVQIELELDGSARLYDYSLSGSRRAISRSLSNCQTHSN